jgi:inorganic pyrophosphatase
MAMIDSGASDDKIIAVATIDPEFNSYVEAKELAPHRLLVLKRFFQDYKSSRASRCKWKTFARPTPPSR